MNIERLIDIENSKFNLLGLDYYIHLNKWGIVLGKNKIVSTGNIKHFKIPDIVELLEDKLFLASSLESIILSEKLKNICAFCFCGCDNLKTITVPDSVTDIKEYAFYGCTSLQSITLGKGVIKLEESVFENCVNLQSITIPDNIMKIGEGAFRDCSKLTRIEFRGKTELDKCCIPRELLCREDFIIECPENLIDFYSKQLNL